MQPHGDLNDDTASPSRWWLAAAALAVALAVPFVMIDLPPVLDYPNHLARYFVLAHPTDPLLSQMYEPRWAILPNLGMDVLGALLLRVTDVHIGGRMLLALSLFAPVIGVVVYSRVVFGRLTYWPLASGLAAYNGIFFMGFMNFLLSLGLAFMAAAGWIAWRRQGNTALAVIVGALFSAVIFLCHIFGVVLFALLIGAFELARLDAERRADTLTARDVVQTALLGMGALAPALVLYVMSPLSEGAPLGPWGGLHKLWDLLTPFLVYSKPLTLLTAVAFFSVLILARRQLRFAPGGVLVLAVLGAIFIVTPTAIKGGTFVDNRIALMIALVLFAGVEPQLPPRSAIVVGVILAALIGLRSGYIASVWASHRENLAELRSAIAKVEPGKRVLVARGYPIEPPPGVPAAWVLPGIGWLQSHMPALLVIERRAFWPLLFADASQQPLVVKPPYDRSAHPLSDPVHWSMLNKEPDPDVVRVLARYLPDWRTKFDNVLLLAPTEKLEPVRGLTPLYESAFATLYRIEPIRTR
ncbi:MAG: hypothetical protein A4S14_00730 [Proteobacteria bacterium SG_bin9]|nr:MAG: hypothetical protein A4S14_00730 [Proteobacteria bacterium SG_bin9]